MSAPLSAVGVERLAARNLRRLRTIKGMSAERLSLAIDCPAKHIRDIEQGYARLRVDILVAAARALGVSEARFFEDVAEVAA